MMELYDLINGARIQGNICISYFDDNDIERIVAEFKDCDGLNLTMLPDDFDYYVTIEYIFSDNDVLHIELTGSPWYSAE